MSIDTQVSPDGRELIIAITGRFDFGKHQAFRSAYERLEIQPESFTIDLKATTYIDSSALGMLLLMREYVGGEDADIRVINPNPDLRKILAISNFEKLFDIG